MYNTIVKNRLRGREMKMKGNSTAKLLLALIAVAVMFAVLP